MRIYRLCKEKYAELDGYGAFLYGGRWNFPGKPVVYAAENRALAALEFLVGVEHHRALRQLLMLTLEIPDTIKCESLIQTDLSAGWRYFPAPQSLAKLGDEWLKRNQTCLLKLPSVHVPEEHHYLLNPRHVDFKAVQMKEKKTL